MRKVSLYTRSHGTRELRPATRSAHYPLNTIFVLRWDGHWKTQTDRNLSYAEALAQAKRLEIDLLTGEQSALAAVSKPRTKTVALSLDRAIDNYRNNLRGKSHRTNLAYILSLKQFLKSSGDKPITEIGEQDLMDFENYLRDDDLSDRTVANRMTNVVTFLRTNGIRDLTLKVRYTEKKVRAYRTDELKALFAACTPEEWLLFQFFLCSGAREQEAEYAEKQDVDFRDKLFTIREKERFNFKPKDYEEREIPLPDFLLAALETRPSGLLFPTALSKPNGHLLRILQRVVERAHLSGVWILHKFRKTYATLQHKDGVDARTIQKRLGHSSLETTLAYLEGEEPRSENSRQQVNSAFGTFGSGVTSAIQ